MLDEDKGQCVPESSVSQASQEEAAPFKSNPKIERCITDVKANLRKKRPGMESQALKSTAIAICRSRMKQ